MDRPDHILITDVRDLETQEVPKNFTIKVLFHLASPSLLGSKTETDY